MPTQTHAEDESIIDQVIAGDRNAFRVIVLRYQGRIFNMTYRFLGNREEAEDLAQEIFVNIYRHLKDFRKESKFSTWVYRIVQNHCLNRSAYLNRRRVSNHESLTLSEDQNERGKTLERDLIDSSPTPEQSLADQEADRIIEQGISQLSDDFRQILVLRDLEGLSYEEIADILQISLGTVKSRIHRARLSLKEQLNGLVI